MKIKVVIRQLNLPNKPRVFDVIVNEKGEILQYQIKDVKGYLMVDAEDIYQQIQAEIVKMAS